MVVIGIGNQLCGDDAAGRAVVRALRGRLPQGVSVVEVEGDAGSLLSLLEDCNAAFLVDACLSGAPAGTIHRFDVSQSPLPQLGARLSTHGISLAEAIELARTLGQLPSSCIVYAVEGESFRSGETLSDAVAQSIGHVAEQIQSEARNLGIPL